MKKQNVAITHESFPQFIAQLEKAGARLNGQKIGRSLASLFNTLISSTLFVLAVCAVYVSIEPEEMSVKELFSHIPDFFREAGHWVLGLFPNVWICLVSLLLAIPVSGLLTGILFRWIPFKGKAVKLEMAETPVECTDNAIALVDKLQYKCNYQISEIFTPGVFVTTVLTVITVLALPIISVCRSDAEIMWSMMSVAAIIVPVLVALCVLCFAVFWLAVSPEWVTGLLYKNISFKKEKSQLEEYRKLLDKDAEEEHRAWVKRTEAEAVEQLISGRIAVSLKTLSQIEGEAKDEYYIKRMAEALVEDDPDVWTWMRWLDWEENKIDSEALREFLRKQQADCSQKLLNVAEEEYPKALELLEKGDYENAIEYLRAADAMDYRDGVALYALAEYRSGRTKVYGWIIERLIHGLDRGMENDKLEVQCRSALDSARTSQKQEMERKEEEKRAEDAYWLEVGRQINMTCKYKQGDYCCWSCTLDNFPPLCFYRDRPQDMYMCDKRET